MAKHAVRRSITFKLLSIITVCAIVFAAIMSGYIVYFKSQLIKDRNHAMALRLQKEVDLQIRGKLDILLTNTISLSHNAEVIRALQQNDYTIAEHELQKVIKKFEQADFKGTGLHLIRADMTSMWRSFLDKRNDDISFRSMVQQVASSRKPVYGVETGVAGVGLRSIAPVFDRSGAFLGMLEGTFGVGSISRQMAEANDMYILLVDKTAVPNLESFKKNSSDIEVSDKYFTANRKWFTDELVAFAKSADYQALLQNKTATSDKFFYAATEAKDMTGKVYGLHLTGMPKSEYDKLIKPVFALANNLIIAITFMGFITALVIMLIMKKVVITPINSLSSFLLDMGNDLTKRFNWQSNDEIGQVASSVNSFLERLQQVLGSVTGSSGHVNTASTQLSLNAKSISDDVAAVAEQASSVATASEEMAATSADIARNCQIAAEGAQQAAITTNSGFDVVRHTVDGIKSRGVKTQEIAEIVSRLGERSDQIGDIASTIEDIADQTNLLALNAAIEAARAGEMGRGFAVVADEVRALAERTSKATGEIGEMIKTIQTETREAIKSMHEGVTESQKGAAEAEQLETALQGILDRVSQVTDQINQIAVAAEEQTATTGEIAGNINRINDVASAAL
ncbi:MAG: methyl-accepting chemotaxis protein, partial [Trichlorobacter sp.]|nr:methyl-accepting chemotaxis protein [Trichlorobacter sp.]